VSIRINTEEPKSRAEFFCLVHHTFNSFEKKDKSIRLKRSYF